MFFKKRREKIWNLGTKCITFVAPKPKGRFVYRLGRKILNLKRGVRFPYRLPRNANEIVSVFLFIHIAAGRGIESGVKMAQWRVCHSLRNHMRKPMFLLQLFKHITWQKIALYRTISHFFFLSLFRKSIVVRKPHTACADDVCVLTHKKKLK